jgi:signal transduction histidine kinase
LRLSLKRILNILLGLAISALLLISGITIFYNYRLDQNQRYILEANAIDTARYKLSNALSKLLTRQENILIARNLSNLVNIKNQKSNVQEFTQGLKKLEDISVFYPIIKGDLLDLKSLYQKFLSNDLQLYDIAFSTLETQDKLNRQALQIGKDISLIREQTESINGIVLLTYEEAERKVKASLQISNLLSTPAARDKFKVSVRQLLVGNEDASTISSELNTDFVALTALLRQLTVEPNPDVLTSLKDNQAVQLIQAIKHNLLILNFQLQNTPDLLLLTDEVDKKFKKVIYELLESPTNLFELRRQINDKEIILQASIQQIQKNVADINFSFQKLDVVSVKLQASLIHKAKQIAIQIRVIVIIVLIVVLLLMIILGNFLENKITNVLNILIRTMKKIANEELDLSFRLEKTSFEDFNQVSEAFNIMSSRLQFIYLHLNELVEDKTNQLRVANQKLLASARQAGMAEVAAAILHNIGNILNSTKVSVGFLKEKMAGEDFEKLIKIITMVKNHKDNLAIFFTQDPKGKKLPEYLIALVELLKSEDKIIMEELLSLENNLKHIEGIVATQTAISGISSGITEKVYLPEAINTAIKMCETSLKTHHIESKTEFKDKPAILTDNSKLLQILVNLIQNAKDSLKESKITPRMISIVSENDVSERMIKIIVTDNGIGIPKENLIKIFSQGFTTKEMGHGFGLHSSAIYAKELGGSLQVESKGQGQGATFILILPLRMPN